MPFTLSHAVLAPPIAQLTGHRLPIAALTIGCMLPDLSRLFTTDQGGLNHLWSSIVHPNLWLGLAFCAAWYLIYRPVLYRALGIQHELNLDSFKSALGFLLAVVLGLLLGNATHLIWDGLTHVDFRTFAFHDLLSQPVSWFSQTYPLHFILQIGSSLLALPFLLWMCWRYYQRYRQHWPVSRRVKQAAAILIGLAILLGAYSVWDYARYFSDELWYSHRYYFLGRAFNEFSQGALIILTTGCILFQILDRNHEFG